MSNRMVRNIYSQAANEAHTGQDRREDKAKDNRLPKAKDNHKDDRKDKRKDDRKGVINDVTFAVLEKRLGHIPTTEEIDFVTFKSKRLPKTRINGNVPVIWKEKLDVVADHLGVNKYDMVAYLIGKFLGEV